MKAIWDITRLLSGVGAKNNDVHQFNTHNNTNHDFQTLPEYFNNYLLSITGKYHNVPNMNDSFAAYLSSTCNEPYPNMNYQYTSTKKSNK
jgi:hypothetical protein